MSTLSARRQSLAVAALVVSIASVSLAEEQCIVEPGQVCGATTPCGDMDASGTVTSSDALRTLRIAVGLPDPATCECSSLSRFADNGDGTITDRATGLMWERKEGPYGAPDFTNPHDVDNAYTWCEPRDGDNPFDCKNPPPPFESYPFDGTVATDFLADLNTEPCFAGHCDWRLPTANEFDGILVEYCQNIGDPPPCVDDSLFLPLRETYWTGTLGPYPNFGILRANTTYGLGDGGYSEPWRSEYVIAVRAAP